MAEEARPGQTVEAEEDEALEEQASKVPSKPGFLARFLTPKWLLLLLAVSAFGHAIGFAYCRLTREQPAGQTSPEISLGEFRFEADPAERGRITAAEFTLHIALLSQVEAAARAELQAKEFRVRQSVEELTRRARSGDFEDPLLAGLKSRFQEGINNALEMRVIADVIITDLELVRTPGETGTMTETADTLPWAEKPPG